MPNSPLQEQPRNRVASVIPAKNELSILDWLKASGRLVARDRTEADAIAQGEPMSDIADIIDPDDPSYEDDFEDNEEPAEEEVG
ncbi:DUF3134 family protein [Synechocystis sp. PCC 7509]|uniref:DUF3134 family protein n=1 Tax=Synechocystis sp. PCC 7509 TaxID=927677 RepID=UPI0002ACACE7|nr:DUF3134 family protein [Synechocystis sp. PCC 7509]